VEIIKLLSSKVINQIAAGEVVERPASVVKELVENALDAKASFIEINILDGGTKLIKVADNGKGMTPEDAQLAVQKHTTSKISVVEDLSNLNSFGFRGEALSSIASVSQFELSSRITESLSGISVEIKGGEKPKIIEIGRPPGTTLSVSNLFFNTPARLKFMKKKSTEEHHILLVVTTYAMAFPEIGFKLVMDDREVINAPTGNFETRLSHLWGRDLSRNLLPLNWGTGHIKIHGVVSAPTITRPTRENMFYFVNKRWISNPSLGHAVMTAYHTLLPTRRFPTVALFLEIPPNLVDVNVHPTKKEVKFANDREIYDSIVRAIRESLLSATGSESAVSSNQATNVEDIKSDSPANLIYSSQPSNSNFAINENNQNFEKTSSETISYKKSSKQTYLISSTEHSSFEQFGLGKGTLQARRIDSEIPLYNFSQLFNTFIVFQSDSEMFIADQHTVHERLNYERLMRAVREKTLEVQSFLVPQTIELSTKEAQVLKNNFETLMELGVEIAPFGGNTFLIRSVPSDIAGKNVGLLLKDILDEISSQEVTATTGPNRIQQIRERTATFLSCRSAVMAGDRLTEEQMRGLIEQMRKSNLPFTCPHGRPTILAISLSELYRRFDRH
jgi:DNA mismatch repair protein MutL